MSIEPIEVTPPPLAKAANKAKYLTGSTMSHVINMTFTSALGLIAVFSVDFVDLFFLSQLEDRAIQAALGFTGTILFTTVSVGIGFSIATSATVSRAAGERDAEKTNRLTINSLIYTAITATIMAIILFLSVPALLELLGAKNHVLQLSIEYLYILVPTMPLFALSISSAACLRALGDPVQAVYVTLSGAFVNAALDPLLIFTFDMGMNGAAIASAAARVTMMLIGLYGLLVIHKTLTKPNLTHLKHDFRGFRRIAIPAILTNLATPIGNGYVTYAAAPFGNSVIAAWAIITRLVPVAFAAVFALSGAVGPIMGQNLGGKQYGRVKQTLMDAITFNTVYLLIIWAILAISAPFICDIMQLDGEAAELVTFFCYWLTPIFGMIGYLFIANAAFNNLDKAHYSTWLNWGRATLGTVPFILVGIYFFGTYGLFAGHIIGGAITAFIGIYICHRLISNLENQNDNKSTKP